GGQRARLEGADGPREELRAAPQRARDRRELVARRVGLELAEDLLDLVGGARVVEREHLPAQLRPGRAREPFGVALHERLGARGRRRLELRLALAEAVVEAGERRAVGLGEVVGGRRERGRRLVALRGRAAQVARLDQRLDVVAPPLRLVVDALLRLL